MINRISFLSLLALSVAPALAADWSDIIIGDDEVQVPLGQLVVELDKAPPDAQVKLLNDPKRLRDVLGQMYLARILAAEAEEKGLDKDPRLAYQLESYRLNLLAKARLRQIRNQPVPDLTGAAREYYLAHRDEFKKPPRIDFSHILVQWQGKPRSREEAMELAQELLARIREGEDIAKLADEYSDDPSVKTNHGHLGWHSRDNLKPAFAEGLFALGKGDAGLVESRYGVHVVRVWNKEPARQLPFDAVKDEIMERMAADIRKERVDAYLDGLKRRPLNLNRPLLETFIKERKAELGVGGKEIERP